VVRLTSLAHHESARKDILHLERRNTTDVNPWRFIGLSHKLKKMYRKDTRAYSHSQDPGKLIGEGSFSPGKYSPRSFDHEEKSKQKSRPVQESLLERRGKDFTVDSQGMLQKMHDENIQAYYYPEEAEKPLREERALKLEHFIDGFKGQENPGKKGEPVHSSIRKGRLKEIAYSDKRRYYEYYYDNEVSYRARHTVKSSILICVMQIFLIIYI